ncbi:hypothetical protein NC651_031123 [Populus alba x Populus x berolinensis]|nr:hypothetical protein NC651_031123 [Populus alba x Populus x berolinensis]
MELDYQPFPSLRHLWIVEAESTDGSVTTTAASLVRAKDGSGFVKWASAEAKKEQEDNNLDRTESEEREEIGEGQGSKY